MRCFARFGTIEQFKKREKDQWGSVAFIKVATLFKLYKWYQIGESITYQELSVAFP